MAEPYNDSRETGMPFDDSVLEEKGKGSEGSGKKDAPNPEDVGFEKDPY